MITTRWPLAISHSGLLAVMKSRGDNARLTLPDNLTFTLGTYDLTSWLGGSWAHQFWFPYDWEIVGTYRAIYRCDPDALPPLIVSPFLSKELWDGYHRATAAQEESFPYLPAYYPDDL